MKKIFLIFLFIAINGYSQKTVKLNFTFNNLKINYYYTYFKNNNKTCFYIIINNKESNEKIIDYVNKQKITKNKMFFLTIPNKIKNQEEKEILMLEFITSILKMKLIDSKMNILSDFDYFKLYEETRKTNNSLYKYSFLNPINSLIILKDDESIYEKLN